MQMIGEWEVNSINCCDALTLLAGLPDNSVDMILTDPPYGVLDIKWDSVKHWKRYWQEIKRVLKPQSACMIMCVQPFTSELVMSNRKWFRQELIWEKQSNSDFLNAKLRHMRIHENILVFSSGATVGGANGGKPMTYYPQMKKGEPYTKKHGGSYEGYNNKQRTDTVNNGTRYPTTILKFGQPNKSNDESFHPTEKPVKLFEYLIKSYSQPGDLVVDMFSGSGTTAVAARNLDRRYIVGDMSADYCAIAEKRLALPYTPLMWKEWVG